MRRFSLFFVGYVIACVAIYLTIAKAAEMRPGSFVRFAVDSLGHFYGGLLYGTGMLALYTAGKSIRHAKSAGQVTSALPVAALPVLIGTAGLVQGYIEILQIIALSGTYPKPAELWFAYSSVLIRLFVGIGFTTVTFALIAIAMLPFHGRRDSGDATRENASQ